MPCASNQHSFWILLSNLTLYIIISLQTEVHWVKETYTVFKADMLLGVLIATNYSQSIYQVYKGVTYVQEFH